MINTYSGWVTFAGVVIFIAGMYNLLSGVAAITESDSVRVLSEVLYGIDIEVWGWFWLAIGIAQLFTAILVFGRSPTGAMLALLGATIGALFTIFLSLVAPLWAMIVLALELVIIWAILAHPEDFDTGRA